jgi:APA family basic amino acid/polyamine antiporter
MTLAPSPAAPSLARVVGLWGAVLMGLGSILGTGVFVSLTIATGVVGQGVVLAVALAALVATANGLSSAQLAAAHPVSGGTYAYGHRFIHPLAGFSAGWLFLAAKSASAATAALGAAGYLLHAASAPPDTPLRIPLAVALVLGLTALVAGGVRRSNRANAVIVGLTLTALAAFVVAGALTAGGPALASAFDPGAALDAPEALLHATALMFVAFTGYGRIATLGEEVRAPSRTIPRAIIGTLAVSAALYIAVAAVAVAAVGPAAFGATAGGAVAPLEVVAGAFDAAWVAPLVAAGAITAMAGVLLNLLLGLSRVLFAMSRGGEMPRALDHVGARTASPDRAVWTIGAFIAGLVLLGDVRTTWSFSAFTVLVYYGITNLAALRLPPELRRYPRWIAASGLVACAGLAFFVDWPIWLAGLVLLAAGLALRVFMLGRGHPR